jgi:subtilisin family serine protease
MRKLRCVAIALGLMGNSIVAAHAAGSSSDQARQDSGAAKISRIERHLIQRAEAQGALRVLVTMPNAAKQGAVLNALEQAGSEVLLRYEAFPILLVKADSGVMTGLASDPRVIGLEQDVAVAPTLDSTIPLINADDMHGLGYDGTGTAVAILDTGIDVDHPFFAGRIVSQACYSNAGGAGGNVTLCPNGTSSQTTGNAADAETAACINAGTNICPHGSHVAGIAAGDATGSTPGAPGDGVAPDADIVSIQIFTRFNAAASCSPSPAPCVLTYTSDQILGLQRVANIAGTYPIVSANMSLGGGSNSSNCDAAQASRKAAIDTLVGMNIATVIAAGNDGFLNAVGAPGCISTAVTVGATTDADAVASYSNRGPLLDLFAPGSSVNSSIPDDTYAIFNGTSMATPHVAGAWAVLREAFPSESVADLVSRFQTTGVPITYSNGITNVTTPRIDLLAAFQGGSGNNNDFASATVLSGVRASRTGDTNVGATKETGEPNHAGNIGGKSVWYQWTAGFSGRVTVHTGGSTFDTLLAVYTGSAVGSLSEIASNDDVGGSDLTSRVVFDVAAGTTYRIAVDGYNGGGGAASGSINLDLKQMPFNDDFADATVVSGTSVSRTGDTNQGGTEQAAEPNHAGNAGGASVWYRWTPTGSGQVTVDTFGSNFDTLLAVYTGSSVGSLTPVVSNDDTGGLQSQVSFPATAATTYQIAVDGYNGETGSVNLHLAQSASPPTSAPSDFNGDGRSDLLWRNSATGEDYLWFMNGTTIGSSGPTFTLADQNWKVAGTGDFDGNAKADIVWRNASTGQVYVWLMDGTTISSSGPVFTLADQNWKIVGTADFNGDGKSDLLWRNAVTGENYLWFMDGTTLASSGATFTLADLDWKVVGTGDFDGDAKADIVWRNASTGQVYVWLMNGTAIASSGSVFTLADPNWQIAGTGDFNGNGRSDLLWRNASTGEVYVWLMNGTAIASSGSVFTVADTNWQIAGTGDYDGNAKADIVWRNASTGEVYVWLMDGTSIASSGSTFVLADQNWQIVPSNPPAGQLFAPATAGPGMDYTVSRLGTPKLKAPTHIQRWWHRAKGHGPRTRPPTSGEMTWTVKRG